MKKLDYLNKILKIIWPKFEPFENLQEELGLDSFYFDSPDLQYCIGCQKVENKESYFLERRVDIPATREDPPNSEYIDINEEFESFHEAVTRLFLLQFSTFYSDAVESASYEQDCAELIREYLLL